jgi:hypothetical protein
LGISNKGNTILLRGKYDVVEREIRYFDKCHVGLFYIFFSIEGFAEENDW